jgi:hypothetical protein
LGDAASGVHAAVVRRGHNDDFAWIAGCAEWVRHTVFGHRCWNCELYQVRSHNWLSSGENMH